MQAFVIDSRDSFDEIRKHTDGKKLICGNLVGPVIDKLDEKALKTILERMFEQNEGYSDFVFGTSAADISYETDLEKIDFIVRTLKEYYGVAL